MVETHKELPGYELYVVEQWAASRNHLTSLITTFTGLTHHKIKVNVLGIPRDEADWSDKLQTYIRNTSKPPARRKETPLGILMVTNLSSFASSLTVVNIPGGNYDEYRDLFVVNENLKRLGCSGRAGLNLSVPSGATQAKFRQLYHTSEAVPVIEAAVELVRLCQLALVLYSQLAREYTDGLLCDITVNAIRNWWSQIGAEHFNIESNDESLGPTSVAALLGLLQGARIRLQLLNAPIGKDVFDLRSTKRAIEAFQKWYKLDRTRRLDAKTLDHLHKLTAKNVKSEGWVVPRAVKSTIPQLGKGGEMVMGMVSNKERIGVEEVETLDMHILASTASGDAMKWLWHGKQRNIPLEDSLNRFSSDADPFSEDDTPPRTYRKRDIVFDRIPNLGHRGDQFYNNPASSQASFDPSDREQPIHKHVLKSVTDRMSDAKSGLGRIRDAVGIPGLRGHVSRISRDHTNVSSESPLRTSLEDTRYMLGKMSGSGTSAKPIVDASTVQSRYTTPEQSPPALRLEKGQVLQSSSITGENIVFTPNEVEPSEQQPNLPKVYTPSLISWNDADPPQSEVPELARSMTYTEPTQTVYDEGVLPHRTLSFEDVSDALFDKQDFEDPGSDDLFHQYAHEEYLTELALSLEQQLNKIEGSNLKRAQRLLQDMQKMDNQLVEDQENADKQYFSLLGQHDEQKQEIASTVTTARSALSDTLLRIEGVMSKLEYELDMLTSKVEDMEDGVADFENQVVGLEARADALEPREEKPVKWPWRLIGLMLGFM